MNETFVEFESQSYDQLFNFEALRKAFKTFVKFGYVPCTEMGLSALIQFNTIFADANKLLALVFIFLESLWNHLFRWRTPGIGHYISLARFKLERIIPHISLRSWNRCFQLLHESFLLNKKTYFCRLMLLNLPMLTKIYHSLADNRSWGWKMSLKNIRFVSKCLRLDITRLHWRCMHSVNTYLTVSEGYTTVVVYI